MATKPENTPELCFIVRFFDSDGQFISEKEVPDIQSALAEANLEINGGLPSVYYEAKIYQLVRVRAPETTIIDKWVASNNGR